MQAEEVNQVSHDTDPTATPTAREAALALIELLDSTGGQPEFATLHDEAFWRIRGTSGELIGRMYVSHTDGNALKLLESWQEKLGGTIAPTGEKYTDNWAWYALTITVSGVPVSVQVPVEQPEIEQQLRDRIAELEAALDDHDLPVPYALTDEAQAVDGA